MGDDGRGFVSVPGNNYGVYTVWSGGNNARPVVCGPIGPLPLPFVRVFLSSSATITSTFTILTAR